MDDSAPSGDLLRSIRESASLSLREMATRLNFSKSYLHEIETGKAAAPLEIIEGYANVKEDIAMKRRTLFAAVAATPLGALNDPASAEMVLRYGLWLGDQGKLTEADAWYHVATALADRTGDQLTRGWVRARIATRGHYEGWPVPKVIDAIGKALSISRHSRVMVESQAALVQVHTKEGNINAARAAAKAMLDASTTSDDHVRSAVFVNYLECMIGDPRKAPKVYDSYHAELRSNRVWWHEANVYLGMAQVRAGDRAGVNLALEAVSGLGTDVRVIGIGVSDLLEHVTWDSSEVEQLRQFARV